MYVLIANARKYYVYWGGTDKRDACDAILSDILVAFSKLDEDNKLPPIYCEALQISLVLNRI